MACVWAAEDNFVESVIFFHFYMGWGVELRTPGFLFKCI